MLFSSPDPNERFRSRRREILRRRRRQRMLAVGLLLVAVIAVAAGARVATRGEASPASAGQATATERVPVPAPHGPRPLPVEVRGVHVTGPLASLPGKLEEYVGYRRHGLNAIELDIKDEGGEIGFTPRNVPLVQQTGAGRDYFDPAQAAKLAHDNDVYLIGRIVVFQDPLLAEARPDLAVQRPDGSVWRTDSGLAWVNPYDRRVWEYNVRIAEEAARAGFDQIMLDYVRFPSDGDVDSARYPGRTTQSRGRLIADFVAYARKRLEPMGVRVSTALFGLSATRDLGIGQRPRLIAPNVDVINPMTYPALYGGGELGIENPSARPGETVYQALGDFRRQVRGTDVLLVPWIQDFSGYTLRDVQAQIQAARLQGSKGFLLWNPEGLYTTAALSPE